MASSIYVVDSSFKRTQIKVTPGKYLREVLEEACSSRKLRPEEYSLKTQSNKLVDLSQPFRLSGLSAGAKLQLVQASRSPSVVSVAIQLPEELSSTRLTDKFASNVSLWTVLRRFEEGVAGQAGSKLNITQQGVPSSNAGSGRLLYRQPCLNAMGRSLENFTDLQKTLAQLGFNNGSVLMRLSYRPTDTPLEEAMLQMSKYFEADVTTTPAVPLTETEAVPTLLDAGDIAQAEQAIDRETDSSIVDSIQQPPHLQSQQDSVEQESATQTTTSLPPSSSITQPSSSTLGDIAVYLAPTSSTPAAALHEDNDSAFEPSIDDAKALQASLQKAGRNTRLLSDKELEEQEAERQAKLATVQTVNVRVRYADQTMIETTIHASQSSAELYSKVRNTLRYPNEPFELKFVGAKGHQTLPDDASKRLVKDFGFRGKVLITLVWAASASTAARTAAPLKNELQTQAQELKVELNSQAQAVAAQSGASSSSKQAGDGQKAGKASKGDIEAKMKKFLGFGKK